jgi:hypothetical protein
VLLRTPAAAAAVPAAVVAIAVAACGGGAPHASAQSPYGPKSSPAAMSRCMRAHGLTDFPDPRPGPDGAVGFPGGVIVGGDGSLVVDGVTFAGPVYQKAKVACAEYLPPSGGPPKLTAAEVKQQVDVAACMRRNGVPGFPDPTSNPGAGPRTLPSVMTNSPAFDHALQVCGGGRGLSIRAG